MFGTVTKYFKDKGYGFIRGQDGSSYFIHHSNLNGEIIESGYYVFFRVENGYKGKDEAVDITVIEATEGSIGC